MGGRGSSNPGGGKMNVDFDKWGKPIDGLDAKEVKDKDGTVIGYIQDELRYTYAPEERPVTRAEVMRDISGWRNDDGSYGDDDVKIYVAYDDGTFFSSDAAGSRGYRDKLKKTGVIGASISTPDYEMVWGGEYHYKNGKKTLVPWTTNGTDEVSGKSNTYSGYTVTGKYWVREKTTYNERFPDGRPRKKVEVIRKSKVKKVTW